MIHHIYEIVNTINDKKYVGYTSRKNPLDRWKQHITDSSNSKLAHKPLYRAISKYGITNFVFNLLYCSVELKHTLNVMEKHFIITNKSYITEHGYNLTYGGEATHGWVPSEKTKKLWSEQRVGRTLSETHKKLLSDLAIKRYIDKPELKKALKERALLLNIKPPTPTKESHKKSAATRTGKHIHTEEHKASLKASFKTNNRFLTKESIEKRKTTWKTKGRGVGAKNGNAVFAKIYNPDGVLISIGYLRDLCESLSAPFNKFQKASRHGNPLQRGEWKGWLIKKIDRNYK